MISIPVDSNNKGIQLTPNVVSIARTYDATISTATSIILNTSTTFIEVSAILKGVFLKYAANVSSTDFDEYIPAENTHQYVIPTGVTVISVIEEAVSAHVVVIEK